MHDVPLDPHQQEAIDKLGNGKVLYGGTGVGKSRTACAYYMQKEAPKDVYVITTAKKRESLDWEEEFAPFRVGKERNATLAGVLTVDSWNNIRKYVDVKDAFFVFDEQRIVGSGAWTKSFIKIARANHWILLSATPGDTWIDYIPVFVANGFYKNRTAFKDEHVIYSNYTKFPKVERYVGTGKLERYRKQILVPMPYDRHTVRKTHYINVDYDKESLHRAMVQRWHVYEERPIRDVGELFMVMRKVVNSSPARLDVIKCLMEKHPKLIVFYNFNYELEMLRTLAQEQQRSLRSSSSSSSATPSSTASGRTPSLDTGLEGNTALSRRRESFDPTSSGNTLQSSPPSRSSMSSSDRGGTAATSTDATDSGMTASSSFAIAEWNGHKHEPIPTTDRWLYLVQYVAGAEGWNCTTTDSVAFFSLTYSYKNFHQAYGRIDRMNTPFTDLNYYVLKSNSAIDSAILKSLKEKRNFNERSSGITI